MAGLAQFEDAVDGLSDLVEVESGPYLVVYRGLLDDDGEDRVVQLRTVADTVPDPDGALAEAIQRRARMWGQTATHPNIATLLEADGEPRPWLLVADQPHTFAAARPRMTVETACGVVADVAEALRNAALYNIDHGNITPRTVAVWTDGSVTVDDWGLTRTVATHADGSYVTGYTAPEQLDTDRTATTEQTDVYGLGALAYFALTGRPPYEADRDAILAGDLTPPSAVDDALPSTIDDPIVQALDPDPGGRPDGIYAFARAFAEATADIGDVDVLPRRDGVVSPFSELVALDGVDRPTADALRAAGFRTVEQVANAAQSDLASAPGVGDALAARIKAAAGGYDSGTKPESGAEETDSGGSNDAGEAITEVFDGTETGTDDDGAAESAGRPSATELERRADGNVTADRLTESDSNTPLYDHLGADEQPHYYASNVNKGLKIEDPDTGEAETPYNVPYSHSGDRHLLVTDERVLFVGGNEDGSDDVVSMPYDELVGVEANRGWTKARLTVEHADGRRISFYGVKGADHVEDAGGYVRRRVDSAATDRGDTDGSGDVDGRDEPTDPAVGAESADGTRELAEISGVGSGHAESLRESGYETRADIARASQSDLASVPGIGTALAARIKADVEGLEVESEIDGSPTPGDDTAAAPDASAGDGTDGSGPPEWDHDGEDDRSAEEIAATARGNLTAEHLTDSDTNTPLREHLGPGEQPHYYFQNVVKGLRFTHPEWDDKKTPYNVGYGHSGGRYLLVTDRRILFVGGNTDGTDTVVSFPYSTLVGAEANWGWTKGRLTVEHVDGRRISFFDGGGQAKHIEDGGEYVSERIENVDSSVAGRSTPDASATANDADMTDETADQATGEDPTESDERDQTDEPPHTAELAREDDSAAPVTEQDDGTTDGAASDRTVEESAADADLTADERAEVDTTDGEAEDEPVLAYCPSCGEALEQLDRQPNFCPSCGEDLTAY